MVDIPGGEQRPAYLMALQFDQIVGAGATGVEPSGNTRFTVEVTNLPGPILKVTAEAL
jgi:NADH dehydrogenase FAD-containing subunit